MNGDPLLWNIILQGILIALGAVFSCAEISVLSASDSKIDKMAAEGNKRARRLKRLTGRSGHFLSTVEVLITLSGFLGSAFAADHFAPRVTQWALSVGLPWPENVVHVIAVVLLTILISFFTLLFGQLVPKRLAAKNAEKVALGLSDVIYVIGLLFTPMVFLLTVSTNAIIRLFGVDPNTDVSTVTEEDIRMLVDAGSQKGAIDDQEKELITNVFEFDDLTAGEVATHRTDIAILWTDETDEKWQETIHESRHSLYPVCGESVDDVVGILNAKDYFRLDDKSRTSVMKNAVRPAYFVPDSVRADVLFKNMKKTRNHFAVVLDEYGGTYGIVTMSDLVERLLGDMDDGEDDVEPEPIEALENGDWRIRGAALIDDVNERLHVNLPSDEYDTFGGLIFGHMGTVPEDGSKFTLTIDNLEITVLEVREHRMETALVKILPSAEDAAKEEEKETDEN